jgi:hypothetical protein
MDTTSRTFTHGDIKVGYSPFVLFVVGVVEIGAMEYGSDCFADIIHVRFETNTCELNLHRRRGQVGRAGEGSPACSEGLYVAFKAADATLRREGSILY